MSGLATLRQIVCPTCGDSRDVSDRHARRLIADGADLRCEDCKKPREINVGNAEIVFWLEWAGAVIPAGGCGRAYLRVFGVPPKLTNLLTDLNGSVRYLP